MHITRISPRYIARSRSHHISSHRSFEIGAHARFSKAQWRIQATLSSPPSHFELHRRRPRWCRRVALLDDLTFLLGMPTKAHCRPFNASKQAYNPPVKRASSTAVANPPRAQTLGVSQLRVRMLLGLEGDAWSSDQMTKASNK